LPALGLYFRPVLFFDDFFVADDDFLPEDEDRERFDDLLEEERDDDFLPELFDDFFAAFFVAMALPPRMIGGRQSRRELHKRLC
jgi:hypothetical protein